MEAILLVGGKGTRLHPLTLQTPKPMLKLAGVPFIAHQIGYAKAHGVNRIIVATSFKSEKFQEFLGDGSDFGVEIIHAIEAQPLGTGGAIRNAAEFLQSSSDQPVVVLNGDILSAHDITAQISLHREKRADVTLHLIHVPDARAYGSVPTNDEGRILEFVEKSDNPPTQFINAGCYIFTRSVIDQIPAGRVVSVERETFPEMVAQEQRLWGFRSESYWIDIGTPAALLQASGDLICGRFHSPAFTTNASHLLIDDEAEVDSTVQIGEGSAIGRAVIKANVTVSNSIIGNDVIIESGAQISDSIIGDGVTIGAQCQIHGALLAGSDVVIPANSRQFGENFPSRGQS